MVFLKDFFEKVNFEKNQQTARKKLVKSPIMQRIHDDFVILLCSGFDALRNVIDHKTQKELNVPRPLLQVTCRLLYVQVLMH